MSLLWDLRFEPTTSRLLSRCSLPTKLKRQWCLPASTFSLAEDPFRILLGSRYTDTKLDPLFRAKRLKFEVTAQVVWTQSFGNWLFGLVARFSLRVREVLGSIPRTALCDSALK